MMWSGIALLVVLLAMTSSQASAIDVTFGVNNGGPPANNRLVATEGDSSTAIYGGIFCVIGWKNWTCPIPPDSTSFWSKEGKTLSELSDLGLTRTFSSSWYGLPKPTRYYLVRLNWPSKITRDLAGTYKCGYGSEFKNVELVVNSAPTAVITSFNKSATLLSGASALIHCAAAGATPLTVQLYKTNTVIAHGSKVVNYIIQHPTNNDSALYTCKASNSLGSVSSSSALLFNGASCLATETRLEQYMEQLKDAQQKENLLNAQVTQLKAKENLLNAQVTQLNEQITQLNAGVISLKQQLGGYYYSQGR